MLEGLPSPLSLIEDILIDYLGASLVVDELGAFQNSYVLGVGEYLLDESVVDGPLVIY